MKKMTHRPYLIEPGYESCYEYLLGCYGRISADVGDYAAFVNLDCTTMMSKMFEDVEKLASFLVAHGIRRGDVLTVFLPTSPHAFIVFYALSKIGAVADFVPPFLPPAALKEEREEVGSKGIFILDRMHGPTTPTEKSEREQKRRKAKFRRFPKAKTSFAFSVL